MQRRLFIKSLAGGCFAMHGAVLAQQAAETEKAEDADWKTVDTWFGNDSRFYHRDGGRPHGEHSWLDRFEEPNQNFAVCDTNRKLTLDRGAYRVTWDADVIFVNPACRSPNGSYPVLLSRVFGPTVNGTIVQTWQSQVYVCARRENLIYKGQISTNFDVSSRNTVDISIVAFNDERTADPTDINAREVIVHQMKISERSKKLNDSELQRVQRIMIDGGH